MREFFQGWRRKAGLATLAIALALTVGWVNSYSHGFNVKVESVDGIVTIDTLSIPEGVAINGQYLCWYVPYWFIVLPLTLLSAWLLLIKPRPAKSAKESSHA